MNPHEKIDQRSLALARAVADKLKRHPRLYAIGRENIRRWIQASGGCPLPAHLEWQAILEHRTPEDVLRLLTEDSEEGRRLRQSNPFAGVLDAHERWAVLRDYETRAA